MPCNAMHSNAMQCVALQCDAMHCNAIQCTALQCNAMQYNAMLSAIIREVATSSIGPNDEDKGKQRKRGDKAA
eukprot:9346624-Lingulodinium_polyedra.AAC.1